MESGITPVGSSPDVRDRHFLENAIKWEPIVKKYRSLQTHIYLQTFIMLMFKEHIDFPAPDRKKMVFDFYKSACDVCKKILKMRNV